jgi:CubicO group peptidase (beta-lactamase class C family)
MQIGLLVLACVLASLPSTPIAAQIDRYVQPYSETANFSGVVRVTNAGHVVFEKAYGRADREHAVPNTLKTSFHIASLSMQFTTAAILRLVDTGALSLDERVGNLANGISGAEKITIRDLLTQRSGLPDINQLSDYNHVLQQHQTPSTLIAKITGKPLLFEPGSKYLHEEHSAYNLLALIIEKKTGLPFASAVEKLVLRPLGLATSGVDDDSDVQRIEMAKGYQPDGTYGLAPTTPIHWSAKAGNASIYTSAADEERLALSFFGGNFLSADSRTAALDPSMRVGYGWFKSRSDRFGQVTYYMNGRAPGFSSFVAYLPQSQTMAVVLSNVYSSATAAIGYDVAAISLGLPYEAFHLLRQAPSAAELETCKGTFQFGADFYQADAKLTVFTDHSGLFLRWPGGSVSPLIPLARDRYMDRSYWEEVKIERDASGKPTALLYDRFRGSSCAKCDAP